MARRTAAKYAYKAPAHLREDIEQASAEGLWSALLRVDPRRQASAVGFAARRVQGSVMDELRRIDPLTRDQRRQFRKARTVEQAMTSDLGRAPSEEEIARSLGITSDAYRQQLCTFVAARPVDPLPNAEAREPVAVATDEDAANPETQACESEQKRLLARVFETLPERLRAVLSLYYVEERTLREIGQELGLTESRVCQLHSEAIARMRDEFTAAA